MPILAFMGLACQLASIMIFVVVLLLTGVADTVLEAQAEVAGNRGDPPENTEKEKGSNKEEGKEISRSRRRKKKGTGNTSTPKSTITISTNTSTAARKASKI